MSYVYILRNTYNNLYIGATKDIRKRLYCHNTKQGAQFTKDKARFKIVFSEEYNSLVEARRREIQIKKWRREKKEMLIERFQQGLPTKLTEIHPKINRKAIIKVLSSKNQKTKRKH